MLKPNTVRKELLKPNTIRKQIRRLRKIMDERNPSGKETDDPVVIEAYGGECFGLWVLGGCNWTPSGEVFRGHDGDE